MDFRDIVRLGLEECRRSLYRHVDGLSRQELTWQPTFEANPIGYLVWHIARDEDMWINARLRQKPEVWVHDGWYRKLGMPQEGTGYGFTAEQVAAFPLPQDFSLVTAYLDAVRKETLDYLPTLAESELQRNIGLPNRPDYTVADALSHLVVEESLHMGQVWYLRGLQRGINK